MLALRRSAPADRRLRQRMRWLAHIRFRHRWTVGAVARVSSSCAVQGPLCAAAAMCADRVRMQRRRRTWRLPGNFQNWIDAAVCRAAKNVQTNT